VVTRTLPGDFDSPKVSGGWGPVRVGCGMWITVLVAYIYVGFAFTLGWAKSKNGQVGLTKFGYFGLLGYQYTIPEMPNLILCFLIYYSIWYSILGLQVFRVPVNFGFGLRAQVLCPGASGRCSRCNGGLALGVAWLRVGRTSTGDASKEEGCRQRVVTTRPLSTGGWQATAVFQVVGCGRSLEGQWRRQAPTVRPWDEERSQELGAARKLRQRWDGVVPEAKK
jgi:hypothetical protein